MGVVKRIGFFIFCFCAFSAQTATDTLVVKGQMYIQYVVKATDTYKSIAAQDKVNIENLKLHNKNSRLYYKQSLLIPINSTMAERLLFKDKRSSKYARKVKSSGQFKKKDSLNIAVLLPFYSAKNDSLLSFLSESQQSKEEIHKDSYMALDYLAGLITATDSLIKKGIHVNLFVYDTNNDTAKVEKIVRSGRLKDVDLIFGPIFTKNLRIVTRVYGKDKDKTIISPLSRNSSALKDASNIFQIIPPFSVQMNKISDYISRNVY